MNESLKAAEATWDNFDLNLARRVAWTSFGPIAETGQLSLPPGHNLTIYLHSCLKKRIESSTATPVLRELTGCALVCGDMEAERHFFQLKDFVDFSTVQGFDLSNESLKKCQLQGVQFVPHQIDCNVLSLPKGAYDLVVGHQGLHHIRELENLFDQVDASLKPTGMFFLSEWVGPNYLQIPTMNKIISVFLLYALFPSKKMRTNHMGDTKGLKFLQYPQESFDPSEACNSVNLERSLLKRFTYLKSVRFGALCYPMFEGTAIHLSENNGWMTLRVRSVIWIERWLTKLGLIEPLFLMAICERKRNTV